jgi:subtilisin family serine protease
MERLQTSGNKLLQIILCAQELATSLYVFLNLHMQTTTNLNGECSDDFTGTSAAAPLAAGVVALALQAK